MDRRRMNKSDIVQLVLADKLQNLPYKLSSEAFAPSNIALCKYWGKRDAELNLPLTSSLSISLSDKGTTTQLQVNNSAYDSIILNGNAIPSDSLFAKKLIAFLDLFRPRDSWHIDIITTNTIPSSAGLASSASGFAAFIKALDKLLLWQLESAQLSILARLGSGSACRSIAQGFVEWEVGTRIDGMDSYGKPLSDVWPELCLGLVIVSTTQKAISSREAMQITTKTSPFISLWPKKVSNDLAKIKTSIKSHDFDLLGQTAESNAMAMHAMMLSAWPPISYMLPETVITMQKIWQLRNHGLPLYFTQDAGPNIKLLFLNNHLEDIKSHFPNVEIIQPFSKL